MHGIDGAEEVTMANVKDEDLIAQYIKQRYGNRAPKNAAQFNDFLEQYKKEQRAKALREAEASVQGTRPDEGRDQAGKNVGVTRETTPAYWNHFGMKQDRWNSLGLSTQQELVGQYDKETTPAYWERFGMKRDQWNNLGLSTQQEFIKRYNNGPSIPTAPGKNVGGTRETTPAYWSHFGMKQDQWNNLGLSTQQELVGQYNKETTPAYWERFGMNRDQWNNLGLSTQQEFIKRYNNGPSIPTANPTQLATPLEAIVGGVKAGGVNVGSDISRVATDLMNIGVDKSRRAEETPEVRRIYAENGNQIANELLNVINAWQGGDDWYNHLDEFERKSGIKVEFGAFGKSSLVDALEYAKKRGVDSVNDLYTINPDTGERTSRLTADEKTNNLIRWSIKLQAGVKGLGDPKDPFAKAADVYENPADYDQLAMDVIENPGSKSGIKSLEVRDAAKSIQEMLEQGYTLHDLEYSEDLGFLPIDPNYNDAQRLAAYTKVLNALDVVDRATADAARTDQLSRRVAEINAQRQSDSKVANKIGDVTAGITHMLPTVAAYVFDPALGSAITFATSYGSHAEQARQEGAGYGQQQAFGLGSAALDTGTNAITVPTMLKSALPMKELIGQLAKGEFREQGVRAFLMAAGKPMTATAIASQAAPMQAVASNIGGSILKRVTYHSTDPIIDPQSIGEDYKTAMGMSILFLVLGLAGGSRSRQYAEGQIKAGRPIDADTLMGHLADDARTMPGAANLQKDIQTGANELYDHVTQNADGVETPGAGQETGAEAGNLLDKGEPEGYAGGTGENKIPWDTWNNYEKVTANGQEYAKVGDRLYSRHAVDRMHPSGNRFGANIYQAGGDYGRSVAPQFVEDVLSSVKPILQENGNLSYKSGTVEIITNSQGYVVTIMTYR